MIAVDQQETCGNITVTAHYGFNLTRSVEGFMLNRNMDRITDYHDELKPVGFNKDTMLSNKSSRFSFEFIIK